jgi:hypothetical protein
LLFVALLFTGSLPAMAAMLGRFQPNHWFRRGCRKKYSTKATSRPMSHFAGRSRRTLAIASLSLLERLAMVGRELELGLRTRLSGVGMINQLGILRNGAFLRVYRWKADRWDISRKSWPIRHACEGIGRRLVANSIGPIAVTPFHREFLTGAIAARPRAVPIRQRSSWRSCLRPAVG